MLLLGTFERVVWALKYIFPAPSTSNYFIPLVAKWVVPEGTHSGFLLALLSEAEASRLAMFTGLPALILLH